MVKVTVEEPEPSVVPPLVIAADVPPTVTVSTVSAMNPLALMVVLVPTGPDVRLRPLSDAAALTVKLVPEVAVLAAASVTTTGLAPAALAGMVKVTDEEPLVPVVPPLVIVADVPPTVTVSAEDAAKPVALMVALVPIAPEVGLRPAAAEVTVKFVPEVAVLVPSETLTV